MIFNFVLAENDIMPYVQGIKRFIVIDDVDNIFVGDFLLFSDHNRNVIYHVDFIDKSEPGLSEGLMIISLSPCEINVNGCDCVKAYYRHEPVYDLPFPEVERNLCCDMDEVEDLPFT